MDIRYWILDTEYLILDTGYWLLDAGYWILDIAHSILDTLIVEDTAAKYPDVTVHDLAVSHWAVFIFGLKKPKKSYLINNTSKLSKYVLTLD